MKCQVSFRERSSAVKSTVSNEQRFPQMRPDRFGETCKLTRYLEIIHFIGKETGK